MTSIWELLAGSVVLGWVFTNLPFVGRSLLASYGLGGSLVGLSAALGFQLGGVFVATLEPFGVMLPVICMSHSLKRSGYITYPPILALEKGTWALVLLVFILGTMGLIDKNPYAAFYSGLYPFAGVCLLTIWALVRRQTHVLVAVVLAQVFWLMNIGSSNLYDQLSHFLLLPILLVSALLQTISWCRMQVRSVDISSRR